MKKSRVISVLLSMLLLIPCFSLFAGAADGYDVWDGSVAERYSDDSSGYYGDPIEIRTAAEFALFAEQVRKSEEEAYRKCFKLMTDIDLADKPFAPMGGVVNDGIFNFEFYYTGDFNGNGHTIKGLNLDTTVTGDSNAYVGLFGVLKDGAVVRNLNVEGKFNAVAKDNFGVIAGRVIKSSVINCSVNVNATVSAYDKSNTTIYVGGVVGRAENSSVIRDCTIKGMITAAGRHAPSADAPEGTLKRVAVVLGGIVGRANSNNASSMDTITIENCLSTAALKVGDADNIYVGGIFGVNNNVGGSAVSDDIVTVTISDCLSTGNILLEGTWTSNAYVGGLIGYALSTLSVKDSFYNGVLPKDPAGGTIKGRAGIAGASSKEWSVFENCKCSYSVALPAGVNGINCQGNITDGNVYSEKSDEIMMLIQENYEIDKAKTENDEANFVMPGDDRNDDNQNNTGNDGDGKNEPVNGGRQNSQETTAAPAESKGGCGSSVGALGMIAVVLVLTLGVCFTTRKEKER